VKSSEKYQVDPWNDKFIHSLTTTTSYCPRYSDPVGIDQYEGWVEYEDKKQLSRAGCTTDWYRKRKGWISSFHFMKEGK
jgi:hypothetical protein